MYPNLSKLNKRKSERSELRALESELGRLETRESVLRRKLYPKRSDSDVSMRSAMEVDQEEYESLQNQYENCRENVAELQDKINRLMRVINAS